MRVEIDIDEKYTGLSVEIKAPKITQDIEKMISLMRMINMQMAVKKEDEIVWNRFKTLQGYQAVVLLK